MKPEHIRTLTEKRPELVERVDLQFGLYNELRARKLITHRHEAEFRHRGANHRQVEGLLDLLTRGGDNVFDLFCEGLVASGQKHVVDEILKTSTENTGRCIQDGRISADVQQQRTHLDNVGYKLVLEVLDQHKHASYLQPSSSPSASPLPPASAASSSGSSAGMVSSNDAAGPATASWLDIIAGRLRHSRDVERQGFVTFMQRWSQSMEYMCAEERLVFDLVCEALKDEGHGSFVEEICKRPGETTIREKSPKHSSELGNNCNSQGSDFYKGKSPYGRDWMNEERSTPEFLPTPRREEIYDYSDYLRELLMQKGSQKYLDAMEQQNGTSKRYLSAMLDQQNIESQARSKYLTEALQEMNEDAQARSHYLSEALKEQNEEARARGAYIADALYQQNKEAQATREQLAKMLEHQQKEGLESSRYLATMLDQQARQAQFAGGYLQGLYQQYGQPQVIPGIGHSMAGASRDYNPLSSVAALLGTSPGGQTPPAQTLYDTSQQLCSQSQPSQEQQPPYLQAAGGNTQPWSQQQPAYPPETQQQRTQTNPLSDWAQFSRALQTNPESQSYPPPPTHRHPHGYPQSRYP